MMLTRRKHVLHGENAGMSSQNGDISAEACRWHVFEAEYKALSLSKRSLYSAGYAVYTPTRLVMLRKRLNGVLHPSEPFQQPIFFSFGFVQFASDEDWSNVRNARGVKRVLTSTNRRPWSLPETEMERIRAYEATQQVVPAKKLAPFVMGQRVKVLRGLCQGQTRMVITCNGRTTTLDEGIIPGVPLILARGDLELVQIEI
jgi:transcription antitermination factor NusG